MISSTPAVPARLFIPAMAAAILLLLRGVEGAAARVSRIALIPFVVFYSAWEALQGIGVGILVEQVNGLPAAQRGTGADLVQSFAEHALIRNLGVFGSLGSLALIVATIAAGMALYRHANAPIAVPVLLALSGFLVTAHPPPFGPVGLALFIGAVLLVARGRAPTTDFRVPVKGSRPMFGGRFDGTIGGASTNPPERSRP